ncbi:MAG: hypothetical protein OEW99_02505 [Gammaproteobacteria bacterium]|nr:hypothetical protein [Gammaproteobacteria bacterium]
MNKLLPIFALTLFSACSQESYEHILEIDKNAGAYNFEQAVKVNWNKVCFFGPYSNNTFAKRTLGFEWNLEKHSSIYNNDGITLAVFTNGANVITYKEIPRYADFSTFSGKCYPKTNAKFNVEPGNVTHTK